MLRYIEKINTIIIIKLKIIYWKLKYGKKIKIGKRLSFRKRFNILIDKDGLLEIGDNCFFNNDCSINCLDKITIGNDNIFGENVKIYDHNHKFSRGKLDKDNFNTNTILIQNNNWIGSNTLLLSKTNIGSNNIIGAGVVLNEKIEDNKLVISGNRELIINDIKEK